MEPPRAKVAFRRVPDASVICVSRGTPPKTFSFPLFELGGECFAGTDFLGFVQLFAEGFTSSPLRWEHFVNLPLHVRANSLGRITLCQS